MAATSAIPARLAVIAALTTATGKPRALASLFRRSGPNPATARTIASKVNKRCAVVFTEWTDDGDLVPLPVAASTYAVQVICTYAAGSDLFSAEDDLAITAYLADAVTVPAALTQAGALALDPTPVATGLAGGALRRDGYRAVVTPPRNTEGERLYMVTHFFTATIDITQPT